MKQIRKCIFLPRLLGCIYIESGRHSTWSSASHTITTRGRRLCRKLSRRYNSHSNSPRRCPFPSACVEFHCSAILTWKDQPTNMFKLLTLLLLAVTSVFATCTIERNTDRPGGDYRNVNTFEDYANQCFADNACTNVRTSISAPRSLMLIRV